jgi:DUF971 family protein
LLLPAACIKFRSRESCSDLHCKAKIWKMRAVLQPKTIQKIGTLLAIAWPDGQETYLPLETLRRACPCASCGGEPDVLGRLIRPEVRYSQASFDLRGWDAVGGYGLQPRWADGHNSGIYTFAYLLRLGSIA